MEENGLTLLKQEMQNEEIHIKVNAIHRLKTVILSIGQDETISQLIPYLDGKCLRLECLPLSNPQSNTLVFL